MKLTFKDGFKAGLGNLAAKSLIGCVGLAVLLTVLYLFKA